MQLDAPYAGLIPWLEETLGGRVVACERQGDRRSGGRPAFFIDLERGGERVRSYARLRRGAGMQSPVFSIRREHAVLRELSLAGIAVPAPLGYCPAPEAVLLERLAGEDDYSAIEEPARRDAIDRAFLSELVKLHALDVERFEPCGLRVPKTAREFALDDLSVWEAGYDRAVRSPVPLVRFARQWLHRNVPKAPARASLVQGDTGPGQFMFEGDRLTGIVDWEFAHIGDPMLDLAYVRGRDFYNPGADLAKWFALYTELGGGPIDLPRLRYYTVKALLITPLALAGVVQDMHPRTDHAEWYAQDVTYKRASIEALAEAMGIELVAPELPDPVPSEHAPLFDLLEENLRDEQIPAQADPFQRYRLGLDLRLLLYARNALCLGPALREMELDEIGALLGRRPVTREAAMQALEGLVLESGPERDEALVRHFHRHAVREEALMQGALGAGEGARLQPLR